MEKLSKELEELGNDPLVKKIEALQSKFTEEDWDALGNVKRLPIVTPESKLASYECMMRLGVSPDDILHPTSKKEYNEYLNSDKGKKDANDLANYLQSKN